MRRILLTLMVATISLSLFAQIPNGYYDDAEGLSGESLKTELYYIIKDHNSQSYSSLWNHYQTTDDKPNGKVWDMYSDVPGGTPPYEFTFINDQCGNYNSEGDCYNREHSFPKSWFNDASPMVTDIFHIVPTDGYVNGKRSNWPFGETNSPSWTSMNGSKVGSCSVSGYNGTVFEPIDAYKGDFARIYFYMATRYENLIANWENNSSNSDAALNGTSYPCYEEWYLNMLLDWHQNDPVSQKEIDRNDDIYYEVQGNRNPFVDHPEWVALVWGGVQAPTITNVSYSPQFPEENETVTVNAQITDDGAIVTSQLLWGLTSSNLNNTLNLTASGNNYSAQIPGQSAGQEVYFKIKAIDDEANTSLSNVYNYQVAENAGFISLPFTEDFNDETLGIFLDVSVTGPELTWHNDDYQDAFYAKMSNYNGTDNTENEDWLITPAINFDGYTNEKLNFSSSMKDYDDNNCFLYLMYSSNYSGTGNPNNASWIDISSSANWSDGDYTWTTSGEISLASIAGSQVYLAFKYDSQAGSGKTWQIDDVSITIDGTSNTPPQISNVSHNPTIPDANEAVVVHATITDDGSIASAQVLWGYSSSNLNNTLNMNASGSSYSAQIPGQAASTTIYYKVKATDNEGEVGMSTVASYTVAAAANNPPQITNVQHNPSLPEINEVVTVTANITDDGTVSLAQVFWGFTSSSLSNQITMTGSGSNYTGQIPGQAEGQTIYYKIKATDNDDATSESSIMNYTVANAVNTPPQITNVSHYPLIPDAYEAVTVTATIIDDGSISSAEVLWGYSSSNLSNAVNMTTSGSSYSTQIPGQAESTTIFYKVKATDNESEVGTSTVASYTVSTAANNPPQITNVQHSPSLPEINEAVTVSATITDDGTVSLAQVLWGFSSSNLSNLITMTASGSNFTAEIPGQAEGQTIFYKVKATDNEDATSESSIMNYTVASTTNTPPQITNVSHHPIIPDANEVVVVSATITDDGSISSAQILWGYSSSNLSNAVNMNVSGSSYSAQIPGQAASTNVYYQVKATDNENAVGTSDIVSYIVAAASNNPPLITNVQHSPSLPEINEPVTVSATITDDGTVNLAQVFWGFTSSSLSNLITMSGSGNNYSGQIPGQADGQTIYYKVKATDNDDASSESSIMNYTVSGATNTPPQISNVQHNPILPEIFEEVTVSAIITDDGTVSLAQILWGFSSSSLSNQITMTGSGSNYTGQIPGQAEGQNVYYKVKATDNDDLTSESSIMNYTVASATNNPPQINNLIHSPSAPDEAEPITISCNIVDDNAVTEAIVFYGLSSSSMTNQVNMTASGDDYSSIIPGQNENETIYYQVKAIDDEAAFSLSAIQNFTVNETANFPPIINTITYDPMNPLENEEVTITANITDDEAIESALILWGLSESNMSNIISMSASGDNYTGIIPGQNEGITVYFKVQAFDSDNDMTESTTYQYDIEITTNELTLPFMEGFESDDLGVFSEYSVSGDENFWHIDDFDDNLFAKMSNYNGSENLENEDWMISRPINFNNYSNEVLNFRNSLKDYDDVSTFIYIKYSTNYNGISNPNDATWTDLSALANWSPGEYQWVESGDIDLSAINGIEVYLAFQYVSEDGSGKTWQIDNVSVTLGGANTAPVISNISQSPDEPFQIDEVIISALITDDGSIENAEIQYGSSPTEMNQVSNLSGTSNNYTGTIPAQNAGQTIYYRIMAEDDDGAISYSSIYNYYIDLYDGIQNISQADWKVYPNPAYHLIKVSSAFEKNVNLMIYHSSGRLVLEAKAYFLNSNIDISNLAPGMYFIRLNDNIQTESLPLIIR